MSVITSTLHITCIDVNDCQISEPMNNGYSKVFLPLTGVEGFSLIYFPTNDIEQNPDTHRSKISLTRPFYYAYPSHSSRIKLDAIDLALSFNSARASYLADQNNVQENPSPEYFYF